jgi:biopolymer transport protein ExbD
MIASTLVTTNAIDILLPKASGKTENKKSVSVSIQKDLTFYIDQKMVNIQNLESELLSLFQNETVSSIVLRAEKSVPVDYVVKVMDIANRNKFKIILAVNPS